MYNAEWFLWFFAIGLGIPALVFVIGCAAFSIIFSVRDWAKK